MPLLVGGGEHEPFLLPVVLASTFVSEVLTPALTRRALKQAA